MRTLAVAALMVCTGCSSKKKHEIARFIVEIEAAPGEVRAEVAGRPIPLKSATVSGMTLAVSAMVDFKESEVPAKTPVEIKVSTPCGEKSLALTDRMRPPPNESNVTIVRLTQGDLNELVKRSTVLFAPSAKGVKLGDMAIPDPAPRSMSVFDLSCGKPITVGSESAPVPPMDRIVVVAPSASACLRLGEELYGTGDGCRAPWARDYRGFLVYPLDTVPYYLFQEPDASLYLNKPGCTNVSWLRECGT